MNPLLSLSFAVLLIAAAPARASYDVFLKINDGNDNTLNGESNSTSHEDWHELTAFELGAENNISIGSVSAGGGAGKTSFKEFEITKKINKGSARIFSRLAEGAHFDSMTLEAVRTSATKPFYKAEFGLVMAQDISWSGSYGDDFVEETIAFQFGSVRVTYAEFDQIGNESRTVSAFWNRVTNTGAYDETDGGYSGGGSDPIAPTISGTTSKTVSRESSGSFTFTISDADTPASLITSVATSSNDALVPESALSISGTGNTRTVNFVAGDTIGSATITITVIDGPYIRTRDVTIRIEDPNSAPSITSLGSFEVCRLSPTYLRGIQIIDVDRQIDHTLTLGLSGGKLEIKTDIPGGLTSDDVSGNGTSQLVINGAIDELNATLSDQYGLLFTPLSPSTVTLSIRVDDNDNLGNLSATATADILPILTRYQFWEREKFTPEERANNDSDALTDKEGDSQVNLIEFAFNREPDQSDSFEIETAMVPVQGLTYLEASFPVRTNAPNLTYEIQRLNPETNEWETSGFSAIEVGNPETLSPEFEKTTVRLNNPVEEVNSEIIRLLVQYQEQ